MASNPPSSGSQSLWPPPASGSMTPQGFVPSYQFRPGAPPPQVHQYAPLGNHQFHPVGQGQNPGMPLGQNQLPSFSQPMHQYLQRPGQLGHVTPSYSQMSVPIPSSTAQPLPTTPSHGVSFPSSYSFGPSSYGLSHNRINVPSQFQHSPQMSAPVGPGVGQPWLHTNQNASPMQQAFPAGVTVPAVNGSGTAQQTASDWQEFEATDGRRYYYNKETKQSSWEKPPELMSTIERADASTVWKEFTTPEGRKYYYNKETKQSKWTIPDELKLAREQAGSDIAEVAHTEKKTASTLPTNPSGSSSELPSAAVDASSTMSTIAGVTSSPAVAPIGSDANASIVGSEPTAVTPTQKASPLGEKVVSSPSEVPVNLGVPVSINNLMPVIEGPSSNGVASSLGQPSVQDIEEANKGMAVAVKINEIPVEGKIVDDETFAYPSKQEAKIAFKALLESANVGADWNWDQAMRVIANDKRYGALKTLGERKQAFNEYLMQRKKVEAEEKRLRQRKAKEDFVKMLEESKELTSSMRWSKAVVMFEDDKRFKAVEQEADREDLYRSYLVDLQKKEKSKAQEEYRQNRIEFRQFLEACSFIKVDSQWRKVQDQLEDDDRCTRLDKIDRLDAFQDYIRDLEKEEEEQKKRHKEQLRRSERKNRDAFRKLMEEHVADGSLTAETHWRDYCQKVKDSEAYEAVASNTSGSTPKSLFEDVSEELEKKYDEDKARIKDALKLEKITISSSWTFEEFKNSVKESIESISDINLKLVYEDLVDRAKEKEEKEAKKRKRLVKDFTDKLSTIKEITKFSTWEDSRQLFEDSSEYRSLDESLCIEAFKEYVSRLQEKKERERKREEEKVKKEKEREENEKEKEKKKEKERREKAREKERDHDKEKEKRKDNSRNDEGSENMDAAESYVQKDDKKREKERKHRKRHHTTNDGVTSDKDDKEETKKSRRHGSDRKKSRKHAYSSESDSENRHKKHKRDHRDGSRRSGHEELEDGELGEDGEIQ